MAKEFYNRKQELGLLTEKFEKMSTGQFLAIYGRRRVGKTELVKEFMGKIAAEKLYVYVDLTEKQNLLTSFSNAIQEQLGETVVLGDFDDFFKYVQKKAEKDKFVLVIDEFQRFLDVAPEFITKLQHYWDTGLKDCKVLLLLVGSSIGMIQKITNSRAGALYGRTLKVKISPFRYADFRLMFKEFKESDKIVKYAVFGGTPYYLDKAKRANEDTLSAISELMLKKNAELAEEPKNLLEYENVRVHAKYNSILSAIAFGKETLREIQDFTKITSTTIPAYLKKLDELLDLVERKDPFLGMKRLGRYRIRDNFFRFWYKFIFANQTALNLGNTKYVFDLIDKELNGYTARIFEEVVKELLIAYLNKKIKGKELNFENIGNWWNRKGEEIDIVAYNEKTRQVLVGEVKWTSKQIDVDLLESLIQKAKLLNFKGEYSFLLASKSGFTERCLAKSSELGVICLDLDDISKLFDALI